MKFSKISFDQIFSIFQSLQYAFLDRNPNRDRDEDDDLDPRFTATWHNLLLVSGWSENEFFEELEEMEEHECPNCAAERETEALPAIDEKKDDAKSKAN
jgi:hypothetical protein